MLLHYVHIINSKAILKTKLSECTLTIELLLSTSSHEKPVFILYGNLGILIQEQSNVYSSCNC